MNSEARADRDRDPPPASPGERPRHVPGCDFEKMGGGKRSGIASAIPQARPAALGTPVVWPRSLLSSLADDVVSEKLSLNPIAFRYSLVASSCRKVGASRSPRDWISTIPTSRRSC